MNMLAGMEAQLTGDAVKKRLYPDDAFFREALADYRRLCAAATRRLEQGTYLLVKPEAIVLRRGAPILDFLRAHGYEVLGARKLRIDRHASRDVWRYQFNAAPLSVMRAVDILFDTAPSVCLAVADDTSSCAVPVAARLAAHKGSYVRRTLPSESLRGLLGSPTLLLNFVHGPDDPADVLRELGVLLDPPGRRDFLAMLLGCRPTSQCEAPEAVLSAAYQDHPGRELDLAASLACVEKAATGPGERTLVTEIGDALREPQDDERLVGLVEWLAQAPAGVSHWDRAVVAAFLVGHQRLQGPPLVGPDAARTAT
jgi:hypothetical protein